MAKILIADDEKEIVKLLKIYLEAEDIEKTPLNILNIEASLRKIKKYKKSIARFGTSELDLIIGKTLNFQTHNEELRNEIVSIAYSVFRE